MHFCWKERKAQQAEDDLIIFPDEADWVRVQQSTTGRVFVLKFKTSSQRLFFWMQEPKDDKDDELAKKVTTTLNNPPVPGQSGASADEEGLI
jgi:26S proteasome regulatory subunit N13